MRNFERLADQQEMKMTYQPIQQQPCKCHIGEWSGSPHPDDPDNAWQCDDCGRKIECE